MGRGGKKRLERLIHTVMAVNSILRAFAPAAKVTLPVGTGYLFLGAAYGIYMYVNGFSVWYPALMAWLIYGGSLELVAASMLRAGDDVFCRLHDPGSSPLLRPRDAGSLQGTRLEEALSHFRDER